ncbi:MAG: hypothetical protein IJN04_03095 [Clostridia bacterium]|nr:hypothetical protein [Clostridia bacterium]
MGRLNDILGNAMSYAHSFGLAKEYTYEQALDVLLGPKPNAIELAKTENTMVMAHKTTGSMAKRDIGAALCKTHGILTDAKSRKDQLYEAADFLCAAAVEACAEEDHSSFDVLKRVMESDYAKSIDLAKVALEYIFDVKKFDGTEYVYLACANMYGWGCDVKPDVAREFLEKNALAELKEEYHKGVYRLLERLNETP